MLPRIPLLILAVLACLAPKADTAPLRVRASVCENKGCTKRGQIAFAPALVRLEVFVSRSLDARRMAYGLLCDDVPVSESKVDVQADYAPIYIRNLRDVGAGECYGIAVLELGDGSTRTAKSTLVLIKGGLRDLE